jgi:flagellar operon protein
MVEKIGSVPVPPAPTSPTSLPTKQAGVKKSSQAAFHELLLREVRQTDLSAGQTRLKFSAHAQKRLVERQISLGPQDLEKINRAVFLAETKGARQSLLIYGDLALVTSITNRTVVTAVSAYAAENNVFTNIDSAVIVK